MAASGSTSRAIYAGLSCGFVFAVPVAAYIATTPFAEANSMVSALALPFTAGALAGVGILSAVSAVGSRCADEEEGTASTHVGSQVGHTAQGHDRDSVERFFGSRKVPKDVPVIARAQDAMSEEEAWADIDAMLTEDSPISCDAVNSKDIYQIAFEELQRESRAAAEAAAVRSASAEGDQPERTEVVTATEPVAAPASAPAASTGVPPAAPVAATTDQWVALGMAAAQAASSAAQAASVAVQAQAAAASATVAAAPIAAAPASQAVQPVDSDAYTAQRAALASLDEIDGTPLAAPAAPAASASTASAAAPSPAMASYAGRESIWLSALDILNEDTAPSAGSEHPVYAGRHMRPVDFSRAAAVAEGRRANEMHAHVNNLIEEELDKVASPSVRRSGREYLRVIQGGTASMPRLQAEA